VVGARVLTGEQKGEARREMGNFDANRFLSSNQEWETPDEIFEPLNKEFGFTLDVAASQDNYKCARYWTREDDALSLPWGDEICWLNPPYRQVGVWVKRAFQESLNGATVVCLVQARTNTNWWHDYCMKGEVRFIRGRPKFKGCKHGLPQPLAIVVFRGGK